MTVIELLALLNQQGITLSVDGGDLRISAPKGSLTDELRGLLVKHKAELIQVLAASTESSTEGAGDIPTLPRQPGQAELPLSFAQERLWFLDQLDPGSTLYNIPTAVRLSGELDIAALQAALASLIERHESLRARFITRDREPATLCDIAPDTTIRQLDIRQQKHTEQAATITALCNEPFDLATGPLLRALLLDTGETEHILLIVVHHIVADGWSMGVLMREIAAFYARETGSDSAALPELPIQYADYAAWQRSKLSGAELERHISYWRDRLAGAPAVLELPADRPRPATPSYRGAWASSVFPPTLLRALEELARKRGNTLFMVLLAAFNVLIYRYTRQTDLVIGMPVAGRQRTETEKLIGLFVNSVIVRSELDDDMHFVSLLRQVKDTSLDALSYQALPFEKLVMELQPDRDASYAPLFQVMFNLQSREQELVPFAGLEVSPVVAEPGTAKFDLNVLMEDREDGLAAWFEYSTDLFDASTIERMLGHFGRLLEAIVADPGAKISELELLAPAERTHILEDWNQTAIPFPADVTLTSLFEAQVNRKPNAPALVFGDEQISYAELNARANQLARHLQDGGVGPETLVGVYMERSIEMVVALYGILKAGGAYVPLDPEYPSQRIAHMLEDAEIGLLLSQAQLSKQIPRCDARVINMGIGLEALAIAKHDTDNLPLAAGADNAAYVIFTSGSTGRPKGVLNEHRGICNRLMWMQTAYRLKNTDRVLQKTPFSFDVSVWEFFWPLITGARLVIAEPGGHRDATYLANLIQTQQITTLHFVPSMLASFLLDPGAGECHSLKRVICSGEALPVDLQNKLLAQLDTELHNLYGPTEAAIDVTYWACQKDHQAATVPIGRPVANTKIYIVDHAGHPTPEGIPGELWIGGAQVARGYVNRPDLTNEKFIPDPFSDNANARAYRTGDLARFRADGVIEFLGRIDFQVKLRGFRIELGEIEAELLTCDGVQQAVVLLREDTPGDQRLAAYIVAAADQPNDSEALRRALAAELPEYMVPAGFVFLDELPLTPNGKLDRNALPAPDWRDAITTEYASPRNPVEEALAEIWQDLLGAETIGVDDDFFSLGGHSLLATRLVARIRDTLQKELPLKALFDNPTVAGLAHELDSTADSAASLPLLPRAADATVPLSASQQRLWILDQMEPGNPVYNIPWAIRLHGPLNSTALQTALDALVARHESLRTHFIVADGSPVQLVQPDSRIRVNKVALENTEDAQIHNELTRLTQTAFALDTGPLLQVSLLQLNETDHMLHIVMHHIIGDAWSTDVLLRELAGFYNAACAGEAASLPPLPIQFGDYALWQQQRLQQADLQSQLDYWKDHLAGAPAVLDLPTDRPRPAIQSYNGAWHELRLGTATTKALKELANTSNATLYMVLLAAFNVLLHRYTAQTDIVVGTPIAGRQRTELDNLIGMFINTLSLRTQLDGNPAFSKLLEQVKTTALNAYTNQEAPFEKLVEELHLVRDTSYAPLFQVMFILQNAPATRNSFSDLQTEQVLFEFGTAKLDLTLSMEERGSELVAYFEYNTDLFDADTIKRMAGHFDMLLESIVAAPATPVDELAMLEEKERRRILVEWNDTASDYDHGATLHGLFEDSVDTHADKTALVYAGEGLSYTALEQRANQLAHKLAALGAGPGVPVALCVQRSDDMIVALLGILKSGSAYVPLDPDFPSDRLRYMLEDCGAPILVSESRLVDVAAGLELKRVCLDEQAPGADEWPDNPLNRTTGADDIAYIIYTSGSTGKPKGVAIPHRAVVNFLLSMAATPGVANEDRWLAVTTLSFDISILELFAPLTVGATVVLADRTTATDGFALARMLEETDISIMQATPATWRMLLQTGWHGDSRLKILCGGEALDLDLARRLSAAGASLWNMYGPTETTIWSTCERIEADAQMISVGKPIANTYCYILDEQQNPVPAGVAGELCIGGDGVARGYRNREQLTAEKFIPNPFVDDVNARMYRTGDLARHLSDGRIEVLGRTDFQVKLRGFRIELGEIEALLTAQAGVSQSVVVLREDSPGDQRLVGYLAGDPDINAIADDETLRRELRAELPDYMVPAAFMRLETFPLTPNGKVDRKQLPAPEWSAQHEYVAPRNETEESLAAIWADVLGVEQVGVYDDFFSLGGHSLLATRLISRILDELQIEIPLMTLFNCSTIDALAAELSGRIAGQESSAVAIRKLPRDGKLPLSFAQQRLWFLDELSPGDPMYNVPWVMRLRGEPDRHALQKALDQLIARHESMRTIFVTREGEAVQVILPEVYVAIREEDLSHSDENAIQQRITELAQVHMNLAEGPLIYVTLVKVADDNYLLSLIVHHIIFDAWSHGVFLNEMATLYNAVKAGETVSLPPLAIEFADYAGWQRDWFGSDDFKHQLSYWKNKLGDAPYTLDLPTDHPRPPVQTSNGANISRMLAPELREGIFRLAEAEGCSLFMALLATFNLLMSRYSGQDDLLVGTPISGRKRSELEKIVGFFLHTLVVRADLSGSPSFREFLGRTRQSVLEAFAHQEMPFETLVEALDPERDTSRHPLFQVHFVLQHVNIDWEMFDDLKAEPFEFEFGTAKFDIMFFVFDANDSLSVRLEYNTDLFEAETIERMIDHFETLLGGIIAAPDTHIGELPLLPARERRQLLVDWNKTRFDYPAGGTMHGYFERQVDRQPDAPALLAGDTALSYRELNRRANKLALRLQELGVGPETMVAICSERTAELIVAMLSAQKAGGAYVPIDPEYPPQRVAHMLNDSAAPVLLTQSALLERLPEHNATVICLDDFDWHSDDSHDLNPNSGVTENNLGYTIYTSGSTGLPKGVEIEHRNAVALIEWAGQVFQPEEWAGVLASTSVCFDLSVFEIFCPLGLGGRIVLVRDALALPELGEDAGVTLINSVPSAMAELVRIQGVPASVKTVNLAGEPLSTALVNSIYALGTVQRVNDLYGPSEDTTYSTWTLREANALPTIGRPVYNTQAYLLDEHRQPVPIGVAGELYLGGAGVTRGYRNRPDLTSDRYVANPFIEETDNTYGDRLYRTGDKIRYRGDGNMEFLGRLDHQVKLRGFRIELGEIETALASHPAVENTVVMAREDREGDKRLVAYIVAGTAGLEGEELKQWESEQVNQWQDLWQEAYSQESHVDDLAHDFKGWNSSYSGDPIPLEQMQSWLADTTTNITELHPDRALEIGSGTGLIVGQIAPGCSSYTGTDFSAASVSALEKLRDAKDELRNLQLKQCTADQVGEFADDAFDTLILNSVAQYFPDIDYLLQFLRDAVSKISGGGYIFLGDLRSLPLLSAYHASVQLFQADDDLSLPDLAELIRQRTEQEEELLIDPAVFVTLQTEMPEITGIRFRLKRSAHRNELTRFRYDVTLRIDGDAPEPTSPQHLDWNSADLNLETLDQHLQNLPASGLLVSAIPDARLQEEITLLARIEHAEDGTVDEVRDELQNMPRGTEAEDLYALADKLDLDLQLSGGLPGQMTALFKPGPGPHFDGKLMHAIRPVPWRDYGNDPLHGKLQRSLVPILRDRLYEAVPEYMIPSAFVILDSFPLTPNGKINRKALPAPDRKRGEQEVYVAPRTPVEEDLVQIWSEILGVKQIGVHDDFFALGGHSLLATQLISRIRDRMQAELPLMTLFNHPTVAGLAVEITGDSASVASAAITPCDRGQPLPLSFAQQRLWFLGQLEGLSSTYNVPLALALDGQLNISAMQKAVDDLARRHESLRTCFAAERGTPVQIVSDTLEIPVALENMPGASDEELQARLEELAQTPFDLEKDALVRVHVLQSSETRHLLLLVMHHIVSDGWSLGILVRELAALYAGYCEDRTVELPMLPVQYPDFAIWQRGWLAGDELKRQLGYWEHYLSGAPALLQLPTDYPRPAIQTFNGAHINRTLPKELGAQLRELSEAEDATLFMTLLTAFSTLLNNYSGSDDIVVGTPIAGRTRSEIEGLIGFFVNTLAMRINLAGDPAFVDALSRVRRAALDAYAHQELPFEKLVEELQPDRDTSHPPIFQVLFVLQENLSDHIEFHGTEVTPLDFELGSAKFDLSMFMVEFPEGLTASIEYNTDLFAPATIERMLDHFETLLSAIVANPASQVSQLPLMDASERQHVLTDCNDTAMAVATISVHGLVGLQTQATPNAIAVVMGEKALTYKELNGLANRLARHLQAHGAGPGTLVGISCERSVEMAIAVLAVLKSGSAYVPIDPNYPADRISYMLDDSQAPVLLTQSALRAQLPETSATVVCLDEIDWSAGDASNLAVDGESVYAIYTSGSTGLPKGVELTQAGLSNLIQWQSAQPGLNQPARTLQFASLSFDVSFQELFTTWAQGGTVVLIDEELRRDLPQLAKFIADDGIERVYLPYAALQPLADSVATSGLSYSVKDVIVAGEQLQVTPPIKQMFATLGDARLHNQYGPSETHVVTAFTLAGDPQLWMALPPIGTPVANTQVYVLNKNQEPVPVGVPGELYIGGVQVARGYIHRPELTSEKFVPDPFLDRKAAGHRMYKTGDRVRFLPDGNLEYLGRTDDQVKWRGFRIEPGEIEARLGEHDSVQQAAVLLREDTPGDKRLVAYLVAATDSALDTNTVRNWLKDQLPDYMVPSAFMVLDSMPLTPSGKVARRKLPLPDYADAAADYVAPRTPVEETLTQIWADVLGPGESNRQVGIHDDFFELGGHSLLATQLISRVRDALEVELPLISVFNHPSVAEFAADVAEASGVTPLAPIPLCDRSKPLPLSFAQQRLWFLDQLEPGNPVYNVPWAMQLDGPLNMQALQAAIDDLVQRHETLRTLFSVTMGKPQQCVLDKTEVPLESVDATGDSEEQIERRLFNLSRMPFGLGQTPLMRVHVLHVANERHVILLVLHHIIADGWSLGVLYQELVKLYKAHCTNSAINLAPLPLQYADYSVWQQDWFRSSEQQRQLDYWKQQLQGAPALLDLPTDHPRGSTQTYNGAFIEKVLPRAIQTGLKDVTRSENSTLFMVCLAAFNVLLSRYSGQTDICVGTPVAGRQHTELEGLIGFFINTLVMRNNLSDNPDFSECLARVKRTALEAFAHQELPFEKLVDEIHPVRDMSHAPLFQVAFILQNTPWDNAATLHDLEISPIELDYGVAKFDLSLVMAERREGLLIHFEYNTDLFDRSTIERLTGHFETLLLAIVSDTSQPVAHMPLLGAPERQQILYDWNDTSVPYADEACIHTLIEQRAAEHPDAPAIYFRDEIISFGQLNERANQIAHYLINEGAIPGSIIGLCMERSVDLVAGLLGIFKSGAAYVPLDPNYPSERLEWMLEDSAAALIVTHSTLLDDLPEHSARNICLDLDWPEISRCSTTNPECRASENTLAYVIYTSGSTGKPKGVMIEHQGVCNLADAQARCFGLGPDDRMLQFASISFDASIFEIVMGLQVGAAMVLARQDDLLPGDPLLDVLSRHQVTAVTLPPTALSQLPASDLPALQTITVAGEACPPELVEQWAVNRRFFNLYGPTESTVWASFQQCAPGQPVTIGRPISNARLYVLDEYQQPVPVGVAGELCIGGAGLARGYLNRPDLSAEKFLPDPFRSEEDARIYRSGDLVRYLPDGNIEFLGRIDHQVKVRGFRIELGEIETALAARDDIREAVVIARGESLQDKRLVAYIIPQPGSALSLSDLRSYLQESLPEFMVPGAFVELDAFPLTPNGKVDRTRLPSPDEQRMALEVQYIAPRTAAEKTLAEIWSTLLNVEQVGINDNFFELGGDSILSIQIIARAGQAGLHLTPKQLFQHQTIAELAAAAGSEVIAAEQGLLTGDVPLTPIQHWFTQRGLAEPGHFNQSMLLDTDADLDESCLKQSLLALLEHHDSLRLRLEPLETGSNWSQHIAAPAECDTSELLTSIDVSGMSEADQQTHYLDAAEKLQASFNLHDGPILKALLVRRDAEQPDQLLISIHHIAVDWVSWNILLEDLETAYTAVANDEPIAMPAKTSSFRAWAEHLVDYAGSTDLQAELLAWSENDWGAVARLPRDHADGNNIESSTRNVTVELPEDLTRLLQQELPKSLRSNINEGLLTAVLRTLNMWTGGDSLAINLEGHGREELFDDVDLSRTVGWFTSLYPVLLQNYPDNNPGQTLKAVKGALRNVPHNGVGYGVLRYLSDQSDKLNMIPQPEIGFNYLGQYDQVAGETSLLRTAVGFRGHEQSPVAERPHALDIHSVITGGRLQVSMLYSENLYNEATMQGLAQQIIVELTSLADYCRTSTAVEYTPDDFPFAHIDQTTLDSIVPAGTRVDDIYRVTPLQHGMLFHSLFTGEKDVYFARFSWRLAGHIDVPAFEQAWQQVTDRHTSLRTSFYWEGLSEPVQIVHDKQATTIRFEDWSSLDEFEQDKKIAEFLEQDQRERFDFTQAPLLRLVLIKLGEADHRFIWSFHHAIIDGWSVPLVLKEVFASYANLTDNAAQPLGAPIPFVEYIKWLDEQDSASAEHFWRETLAGFSSPTPLPGQKVQALTPAETGEFEELQLQLPAEIVTRLRAIAQQHRLTLNTLVQGSWAMILNRYSSETDVVFGATTSGRPATMPGVESMIGLFLNTLPLRVSVENEQPLLGWLHSLQDSQLELRQHEYASLVEIQGWSDVPRGTPMFESLLAFENYPEMETMWTNTDSIEIREVDGFDRTNFPLTVNVAVFDAMHMRIAYDDRMFERDTINSVAEHFMTLLSTIADNPDRTLGELSMITDAETGLLEQWNQTDRDYPAGITLVDLFEQQVAATPDAVALVFEETRLTYAELNRQANQLAHCLRDRGIGPDSAVGVCMERSVELVVALYGIIKAGGAYLPLDPEYPRERLAHMLQDANVQLLLTQQTVLAALPEHALDTLQFDASQELIAGFADTNPESLAGPDNLAYIIFTSGSTGRPKGVMNEHRGIANRLLWMQDEYQLDCDDRVLQKTPFSFDVSVWEFFWPLMTGAQLVLAKPGGHRDTTYLARLINDAEITTLHFVPSMLQVFLQDPNAGACGSVKRVICSGEALPLDLQERFFTTLDAQLHNLYGPTEATIDVTYWACKHDSEATSVPIGRPVANTRLYIVDTSGQRVPVGVPGELWIGGVQVARGYINRPELSAAAFAADPFSQQPGARVYRTGDLVRWRPDGAIEFLGRIDHQVKLRGFRIELGEIEAQLDALEDVQQSVVLLREDVPGLKQLVGYVATADVSSFDSSAALDALARSLPDYMVPSAVMALTGFSLTPNGKVDRKALPAPDAPAAQHEYLAPRNETEEQLARLWADLLGTERVGIHDDFFALGGHSLVAMQLVSRIMQSMQVELPLDALFNAPTIAGLAENISNSSADDKVSEIKSISRSARRTRRPR